MGPTESMRVVNNNLTPVKTIGLAGTVSINLICARCYSGYCTCADQEPDSYGGIKVRVKIINYDTGEVLADQWVEEHFIFYTTVSTSRALRIGERLQIFFDVCSTGTPPGPYRKAHIHYYYSIK